MNADRLLHGLTQAICDQPCVEVPGEVRLRKRKHPTCSAKAVCGYLGGTGVFSLLADVERHLWAAVLGEETDDAWRSEAAALVSRLRAVGGGGGE